MAVVCAALVALKTLINVSYNVVSTLPSVPETVAPTISIVNDYTIECDAKLTCFVASQHKSYYAANVKSTLGHISTCDTLHYYGNQTTKITCGNARGQSTLYVYLTHVNEGVLHTFQPDGQNVMEDMAVPLFECHTEGLQSQPVNASNHRVCEYEDDLVLDRQRGAWHVDAGGALRWMTRSRCIVPEYTSSIPSYARLLFIGDSHMRFFYDLYVQRNLGIRKNYTEVKHLDDTTGSVKYLARHYITKARAPEFTKDEISETLWQLPPVVDKTVILIGFGSWDLHGNGLRYTLKAVEDALAPAVLSAERLGYTVYLSTPPAYPSGAQRGSWAGQRNNHAHDFIKHKLNTVFEDSKVIDISRLTRALSETAPTVFDWQCGDHILCYRGTRVVGPVGHSVLDYLLFYMFTEPAAMRRHQ
jgi:hypothetical protein